MIKSLIFSSLAVGIFMFGAFSLVAAQTETPTNTPSPTPTSVPEGAPTTGYGTMSR